MVKKNGFTLIEIMIVIAIIAILSAALLPLFMEIENNNEGINEEELDAPVEYIRRDLRINENIKLVRHDDGSLWGCMVKTKNCYMVTE